MDEDVLIVVIVLLGVGVAAWLIMRKPTEPKTDPCKVSGSFKGAGVSVSCSAIEDVYNKVANKTAEFFNRDAFTRLKDTMCACYDNDTFFGGLQRITGDPCKQAQEMAPGLRCKSGDCDCNPTNPAPNIVRYRDSQGGPYETRFK